MSLNEWMYEWKEKKEERERDTEIIVLNILLTITPGTDYNLKEYIYLKAIKSSVQRPQGNIFIMKDFLSQF